MKIRVAKSILCISLMAFSPASLFAQKGPPAKTLRAEIETLRKEVRQLRKERDRAWVRGVIKDSAAVNEKIRAEVQSVFGNLTTMLGLLMGMLGILPLAAAILAFILRRAILQNLTEKTEGELQGRLDKELEQKTTELNARLDALASEHTKEVRRLSEEADAKLAERLSVMDKRLGELEIEYKNRLEEKFEELLPVGFDRPLSDEEADEMRGIMKQMEGLRELKPELFDDMVRERKKEIKALLATGKSEEALEKIGGALELKDEDGELYSFKARALLNLGNNAEAVEAGTQALLHGYSDWSVYGFRAAAYAALGSFNESLSDGTRVVKMRPDSARAHFMMGGLLFIAGRLQDAVESFDRAIELKPALPVALYSRACAHAVLGNPGSALEDLAEAIALDPPRRENAATDPNFASIRDLPEFQELIKEPNSSPGEKLGPDESDTPPEP